MADHYFDAEAFTEHLYKAQKYAYSYEEGGYKVSYIYQNYVDFYKIPTNYPHLHESFEICLVIDGSGVFTSGDVCYPLRQGALFVAEPGRVHEITSNVTHDLYLFFFRMVIERTNHPENSELIHYFLHQKNEIVYNCEDLLHYLPLLNRVFQEDLTATDKLIECFIYEVLQRLGSKVFIQESERAEDDSLIQCAEVYVAKHIGEPVTVFELAKACHISERHLRRVIRYRFNQKVKSWILDKKLNKARVLLDRQLTVKDVSHQCGFQDPNYFSQVFRKSIGVSPTQYRNAAKKEFNNYCNENRIV